MTAHRCDGDARRQAEGGEMKRFAPEGKTPGEGMTVGTLARRVAILTAKAGAKKNGRRPQRRAAGRSLQDLLASHSPSYLNSGAAFSSSLLAFMFACHFLSAESYFTFTESASTAT
jgi:hypothetical protein